MNWQTIYFICKDCGKESWMEIDIETYTIDIKDLICDECSEADKDVISDEKIEKRRCKECRKKFLAFNWESTRLCCDCIIKFIKKDEKRGV